MSLKIKHFITLDLSLSGVQVGVPFEKGDVGVHELVISLRNGGAPVALPELTSAVLTVHNGADGTGVADACTVNYASGTVIYDTSPEALSVAGNVRCTLRLIGPDGENIGVSKLAFLVSDYGAEGVEKEIDEALRANRSWGIIQKTAENAEAASKSAGEAETALEAVNKALSDFSAKDALPSVTEADNGKFMRVVDGEWAATAIPNAEEEKF